MTDADKDGRGEVSFIYRLGCASDVSPQTQKLLMYEGTSKWALRGQSKVKTGKSEFAGGEVTIDGAFKSSPLLLKQAMSSWQANVLEK